MSSCRALSVLTHTHTVTHTPPPALMHFYCPHPLFLLVPAFPPPATSLSAPRLASPSLILPSMPRSPSPSLCAQLALFPSPSHPSLPADRPARPGTSSLQLPLASPASHDFQGSLSRSSFTAGVPPNRRRQTSLTSLPPPPLLPPSSSTHLPPSCRCSPHPP